MPASDQEDHFGDAACKVAGFSLHAGVTAKADERQKLERLSVHLKIRPLLAELGCAVPTNLTCH